MSGQISPIVWRPIDRGSVNAVLGAGLVLFVASLQPLGAQDDRLASRAPTAQSRSASVAQLCRLADTYTSKYSQDHNKTWIILALKGVRHARQTAPQSPAPYVSLAKIYLALEDTDRAKQEAHNALALDPQCHEAKEILALLEPPKASPNDAHENDAAASTEVVAESRRDFDSDGKVDTVSVVMIRGKHDAARGTMEGTFVARVEIDGVTADTFNLNEAFGIPTLSLPDHLWSIVFSDYNHDGQIDFNFGATVSAAGGNGSSWQYKLFTISPEGRIQELRIENLRTLPAAGGTPSTQTIVAAGSGFQYTAPDASDAEDARRYFVWKPDNRVFVESQEPPASHVEQSTLTQDADGDTELLERQVAKELADMQKREDYQRQVTQQLQQVAKSIDVAANRQDNVPNLKGINSNKLEAKDKMELAELTKKEDDVDADFLKNLERDLTEMNKEESSRSGRDSHTMPGPPDARQSTEPPFQGPAGAGHQLSSHANPPFGGKSLLKASGWVNVHVPVSPEVRQRMTGASISEMQRESAKEFSLIDLTINTETGQVFGTWEELSEPSMVWFGLGKDLSGFTGPTIKRGGKTYVELAHGTLKGTYVTSAGGTDGRISGTSITVFTVISCPGGMKRASEIKWYKQQPEHDTWKATIAPDGTVEGTFSFRGGNAEITAYIVSNKRETEDKMEVAELTEKEENEEDVDAEFLKNLENDLAEMNKEELTRSGPDSGKMSALPGGMRSTSPPVEGPAGAGHQLSADSNLPFGGKSVVKASGSLILRMPAKLRRMMTEADIRESQKYKGKELCPVELTINIAAGQVSGTWRRLFEAKEIELALGRRSSGFGSGLGTVKKGGKTYFVMLHATLKGTYAAGENGTDGQISGTYSALAPLYVGGEWSKQTQSGTWKATISANGTVKGLLTDPFGKTAEIMAHIDQGDAR